MTEVSLADLKSGRVDVGDDVEVINELAHREGWTDGHPIIPPTEERVLRMLASIKRDPGDAVGVLQPSGAAATVEKVAVNAVMAGCLPAHMPVVLAAVEAMADEKFTLYQVQTTSHSVSPLLIVNGPIRKELDIASGLGGNLASWRSSAVIGRAVRLSLSNIGGVPGGSDMHTFGWMVKYAYCMGENEEDSPWEPYHVEQGFGAEENTVTVFAAEPPHHVEPRASSSTQGLLSALADSMATTGCRNIHGDGLPIVALCPDHAKAMASEGFSKVDVKRFLFENARVPLYRFDKGNIELFFDEWKKFYTFGPHAMVPLANSKEKFHIIVLGGIGPNSLFIPGFGGVTPITRRIEK